jgi:hypothetical protein
MVAHVVLRARRRRMKLTEGNLDQSSSIDWLPRRFNDKARLFCNFRW